MRAKLVFFILLFIGLSCTCNNNNISRRYIKNVPLDNQNVIQYCGMGLTPADYHAIKKKEIINFKNELKKSYGLNFKVRSMKYFNIAYVCSDGLAQEQEKYINSFFVQIYPRFFRYEPSRAYRIVYFADKPSFRKYTKHSSFGFYRFDTKTLTTYIHSGYQTVWHELIHAFVDDNCDADIPQWFSEGFASFYEKAYMVRGDKVDEGYTNWRMPQLHDVIKTKKFIHLKDFMQMQDMKVDFGYPEARFLFCYLWINNKMDSYINAFLYDLTKKYRNKMLLSESVKYMEKLLDKDIERINREYIKHAMSMKRDQRLVKE